MYTYMYTYMYIYNIIYIHMYIHVHTYTSTCPHIHMPTNLHIFISTRLHTCRYVYLHVCISTYLATLVRIYIERERCKYICYTDTHACTSPFYTCNSRRSESPIRILRIASGREAPEAGELAAGAWAVYGPQVAFVVHVCRFFEGTPIEVVLMGFPRQAQGLNAIYNHYIAKTCFPELPRSWRPFWVCCFFKRD